MYKEAIEHPISPWALFEYLFRVVDERTAVFQTFPKTWSKISYFDVVVSSENIMWKVIFIFYPRWRKTPCVQFISDTNNVVDYRKLLHISIEWNKNVKVWFWMWIRIEKSPNVRHFCCSLNGYVFFRFLPGFFVNLP